MSISKEMRRTRSSSSTHTSIGISMANIASRTSSNISSSADAPALADICSRTSSASRPCASIMSP